MQAQRLPWVTVAPSEGDKPCEFHFPFCDCYRRKEAQINRLNYYLYSEGQNGQVPKDIP